MEVVAISVFILRFGRDFRYFGDCSFIHKNNGQFSKKKMTKNKCALKIS